MLRDPFAFAGYWCWNVWTTTISRVRWHRPRSQRKTQPFECAHHISQTIPPLCVVLLPQPCPLAQYHRNGTTDHDHTDRFHNNLRSSTYMDHIGNLVSKASRRLHLLRELKRTGLSAKDLLTCYFSFVRSTTEYACQVWSTALTSEQSHAVETIQRRAMLIISLHKTYDDPCEKIMNNSWIIHELFHEQIHE